MSKQNFIGNQLTQFVVPFNDKSINTNNVNQKMENIKLNLPKNALIFVELDNCYKMFITDNDNNIKPIN